LGQFLSDRAVEQAAGLRVQGLRLRQAGGDFERKARGRPHLLQAHAGVEAGQPRRLGRRQVKDALGGHQGRDPAGTLPGFTCIVNTDYEYSFHYSLRPDWIEHQLAHAVRDPLGRAYNRATHLPERRQMMQAWADWLDRQRTGAEVVRLRA